MLMSSILTWVLLVFLSFLPPLIYTIWIRNTERCHRQQWVSIFICFIWGSTIAVAAALVLEIVLQIPLANSYSFHEITPFLVTIVVAPVVEEFTKPLALGLKAVRKHLTENLLSGYSFLTEGFIIFLLLMTIRSFAGCLLHASATALTGYGYGKTVMKKTSLFRVTPYFLLAIFIHGFFNFLVSYEFVGALTSLGLGLLFVVLTITVVRDKIRSLDRKNC
jgi:RsiW-degrading membrane proteinase PrsW (M82 family)